MFRRRAIRRRDSKTATTQLLRQSRQVKPGREPRAQPQDEDVSKSSPVALLGVKKRVRFDKKANRVVPPGSCDYRDPALWWSTDDMDTGQHVDCHLALLHRKEAESYALLCSSVRAKTCADPVIAEALLETSAAYERSVNKLKQVFLPRLLPGLLKDFRGMESSGGPLGPEEDIIEAHTRRVVVAQRSCSSQQELAAIAETSTLTNRSWARLLALGDELIVKASSEEEDKRDHAEEKQIE